MQLSRYEENLIANLRGLPERGVIASFDANGVPYNKRNISECEQGQSHRLGQPLSEILNSVIKEYKLQEPRLEAILMEHWDDIVGMDNASHCYPKTIQRKHTLIISVPDAVQRSNLHFQRKQILDRLNQWPGLEAIKRIVLVG